MVPNVITYSALISACEKGKQPERALEVSQAMQWQGVVPNIITYITLINACEKGKQPEQALSCEKDKQPEHALARRGARRNHLQRHDQCLRKGQAGRAGPGGVPGNAAVRCGPQRNEQDRTRRNENEIG